MARPRDRHPLGKCASGKRLDIALPDPLQHRLELVAGMHGKSATTWARDTLEKAIEGEWVFMRRRVAPEGGDDNGINSGSTPGAAGGGR